MRETHDVMRTEYVDASEEKGAVANYWDSLTGSMTRETHEGSYKFGVPINAVNYGVVNLEVPAEITTTIEIEVDPDGETVHTERWLSGYSRINVDTRVG